MSEEKVKGILAAAVIWILIIGLLAVAAKFLILPYFQKELVKETGSESQYKHEIKLAADSFSGYCLLRSPAMQKLLKSQGIKLTIQDDGADYAARMKALAKQDVAMAVFTIDSFVLNAVKLNNFPASIVLVIDESAGADAIVSHKDSVGSIQDLDDPQAGLVLTPGSPSEFLARTIIAHFNLPRLPEKWLIKADGAADVYKAFVGADPKQKRAYVLWEPYVTKALSNKDAHLLLDSSKLKGYIVDVLVVERNYLKDHGELVSAVVEAYLKTAHSYAQQSDGMKTLVLEDAGQTGAEKLDAAAAENMIKRIEWKNTLENYAYFGLATGKDDSGIRNLEEIITNITEVLVKTGALSENPLAGKAHTLFYAKILADLKAADFHPGKAMNVIKGLGPGTGELDKARPKTVLPPLADAEWKALAPVGALRIEPLAFARGTARINLQSERDLDQLATRLASWPQYYLRIEGHARAEGDPQANLQLAMERAQAAADRLIAAGVEPNRIRTFAAPPGGSEGDSQSVSFIVGSPPY